MEFEAIDRAGNKVVKSFTEIGKTLSEKTGQEFLGVGSYATSVKLRDKVTGQVQELEVRDVLNAVGFKDVRFNFDARKAREQGLVVDSGEMNTHAYNLERIRDDKGRLAYLKDKGYESVVHDGDDYYGVQGGKLIAINNKVGVDVSDVFRLLAHAGRDIGAAVGVGLSGIGAAATAGSSLAVAGAMGAAGGVVGESVQRVVDKVLGVSAEKYRGGVGEGLVEDAAVGALGAVAGQYVNKAVGAVSTQATKALANVASKVGIAEEFMTKQAMKKEAGYLASQLPQGWLSKAASAEEAVALDLLKSVGNKGVAREESRLMLEEGKALLASGSKKLTPEQQMEQALQADLLKRAREKVVGEKTKELDDVVLRGGVEELEKAKSKFVDFAYKAFKSREKEIDVILDAKVAREEKFEAFKKIGKEVNRHLGKGLDVVEGKVDLEVFENEQKRLMNQFFLMSKETVLSGGVMNVEGGKVLDGEVLASVTDEVHKSALKLGSEARKAVFDLMERLKVEGGVVGKDFGRKYSDAVSGIVDEVASGKLRVDVGREIVDALSKLHVMSAKDVELANNFRIGVDKLLKSIEDYGGGKDSVSSLVQLKEVSRLLGGGEELVSHLAKREYSRKLIEGEIDREAYNLMVVDDRMLVNSFDMLRSEVRGYEEGAVERSLRYLMEKAGKRIGLDMSKPVESVVRGGLAYATGGASLVAEQAYKKVLKPAINLSEEYISKSRLSSNLMTSEVLR